MTTPVLTRVDLDADPVAARDGAREDVRSHESAPAWDRLDGTDAPADAEGGLTSPPGNGDLDRPELEKGERMLAAVLGW